MGKEAERERRGRREGGGRVGRRGGVKGEKEDERRRGEMKGGGARIGGKEDKRGRRREKGKEKRGALEVAGDPSMYM